MISVVVCSVNKPARSAFAEQLGRSIGVPYELIVIENDIQKLSISAAYNKGAESAGYPFLCFVHEDVSFHTEGWGKSFIEACNADAAGYLGLAGATLKTHNPSPWWITNSHPLADRFRRVHFIQSGIPQSHLPDPAESMEEVLCLDGFFLFCSKATWQITRFDEDSLKQFHFYDLDICMTAYRKGLKNFVYAGCRIEHHSTGSIDRGWVESAESFQKKWSALLPVSLSPVTKKDLRELERLALLDYVNALISNDFLLLVLKYLPRVLASGPSPEGNQVLKRYIKSLLHLSPGKP